MRKIMLALAMALIIAMQVFTTVAAAPVQDGSSCGDTYTVQRGEWLAKIARKCGTSVSSILALNPWIWNPNRIYPGQVLQLTGDVPVQPTPLPAPVYPSYYYPYPYYYYGYYGYYGGYPSTSYSGGAQVTVSTTQARVGDSVTVTVRGFPANRAIDFRVGKDGESATDIYDGTTNASGTASLTVTIPSSAAVGEYWVVHVLTTEGTSGSQAYSAKIRIIS